MTMTMADLTAVDDGGMGPREHHPLTGRQWAIVLVPGVVLLVLGELYKVMLRSRRARHGATGSTQTATSPAAG